MDRMDWVVYTLAVLVIIDGLMTLPFWHLETNTIVAGMGPWLMMLVKVAAVSGLLWLWNDVDGLRDSFIANTAVIACCSLYVLVVVSNVGYLMLM